MLRQMNLKLASHPGCILQVEEYVKALVDKYRLSPDIYPNILISLTEAVNNAMMHGNKQDAKKEIHIRLMKQDGKLCFIVSDQGKGFDYVNLPDPTAPENVTKVGGRGVFLMQQLCDSIRYHDNGSTVELVFHL
jgi:serine/threonine-protein kinase RsbW